MSDKEESKPQTEEKKVPPKGFKANLKNFFSTIKNLRGKKLLFSILIIAIVLGSAIAFFVYKHLKELDQPTSPSKHTNLATTSADESDSFYLTLDPLIINLMSPNNQQNFVKICLVLQVSSEGEGNEIKKKMPIIIDMLQVYFREMRIDDFTGSASLFRLKACTKTSYC